MRSAARIGTAGWSIPRAAAATFPGDEHQLQRYARVLNCAEINSSFYRSHRPEIYARWAGLTPAGFRFAVKLPLAITHEARLRRARQPLRRFLEEVAGLGSKLGVLLVQLPPSLAFEPAQATRFFRLFAEEGHGGPVVVEPRHASWLGTAADRILVREGIARAAADPALGEVAARPGGCCEALRYFRWHGSPRMYWSGYAQEWLQARAAELQSGRDWVIFDNTAGGRALPDALALRQLLAP